MPRRPIERVLITGSNGFIGSHLAEFLIYRFENKECEVYGTVRKKSGLGNIKHLLGQPRFHLITVNDLRRKDDAVLAIDEAKPDTIFHLAAETFVPVSEKKPAYVVVNNTLPLIHICEKVKEAEGQESRKIIIVIAGSADQYGRVASVAEVPISEENHFRPQSHYAITKIAQELIAKLYFESEARLATVILRLFNMSGPRRSEEFVDTNFACQLARIKYGKKEPVIWVGNLEAKRDFTDVRDGVRGITEAARSCAFGEVYNICSGRWQTHKIGEMLDRLIKISGLSVEIKPDPERMRSQDPAIFMGNNEKFCQVTSWRPRIDYFRETLPDILGHCEAVVRGEL